MDNPSPGAADRPNSSSLRLLVIGAHPADVFDQSAGTMAHHTARGDWVGCVVLTHGARVHDRVICDEMERRQVVPDRDELLALMASRTDVKAREVRAACEIVGVKDVYFLGLDDAVLLPTEENVRLLAQMVRRLKPNVVISHFPKEDGGIGGPHATCGQITMMAIHLAAAVDPGDRNPPHRVAQVFYMGNGAARVRGTLWNAEGGYFNDVFVDITDVVHKKLACLDALESQGYGGAYARKRIETNDGAFGNEARLAYAEGFISWKPKKCYYLPLTDMDLADSLAPDHELMKRMSYRAPTDA
jgi:LmbE family N-acetylglucosaminyl deacetylase